MRFFGNNNKEITVSMDGRLTINGKDVVINCSNASKSWWDTDDFYLNWSNDTMTGYNIDKKGRRGNAVFRFVEDTSPISNQRDSISVISVVPVRSEAQSQQVRISVIFLGEFSRRRKRLGLGLVGLGVSLKLFPQGKR